MEEGTYVSQHQLRYEALIKDFVNNGFTEQQAEFLINLFSNYVPIF